MSNGKKRDEEVISDQSQFPERIRNPGFRLSPGFLFVIEIYGTLILSDNSLFVVVLLVLFSGIALIFMQI
jgi:hypothetical protein